MAIKKHLFAQYIQEQENFTTLRAKKSDKEQKYSHNRVFDEPPSLKEMVTKQGARHTVDRPNLPVEQELHLKGSQTVHSSNSIIQRQDTDHASINDLQNGSQTVHDNADNCNANKNYETLTPNEGQKNGSQTVHNDLDGSNTQQDYSDLISSAHPKNGSQTVHSDPNNGNTNVDCTDQALNKNKENGSQTVHDCYDSGNAGVNCVDEMLNEIPAKLSANPPNGSQTVHDDHAINSIHTPAVDRAAFVGTDNGSQTVHGHSSNDTTNADYADLALDSNKVNGSQTVHSHLSVDTVSENCADQAFNNALAGLGKALMNSLQPSSASHSHSSTHVNDTNTVPLENNENGSQTVHNYSNNENANYTDQAPNIDHEPISQISANRYGDYAAETLNKDTENGSQTVHEHPISPKPVNSKTLQNQRVYSANDSRTVHKPNTQHATNGSQLHNADLLSNKTVHKLVSQPTTNGSRTVHTTLDFSSLPSLQRNLLRALYSNSQTNGNRTTQRLNLSYISEMANVRKTSLKNTIWRLKDKGFITTKEYKDGRGGWVVYEIPKEVYLEILTSENGSQRVHERFTKPNTQPPLYNNNISNITTIEERSEIDLPLEWKQIDTTPLQEQGLSNKQLLDLYKLNITTAEIVQQSINHYAWGLKNNAGSYVKYKNHVYVLIGILRKGGIWTESGYESPQELSLKELINRKKQQSEKQAQLIEQLMELEFPEWEQTLTSKEKKEINPEYSKLDIQSSRKILKLYFKNKILLPKLQKEGAVN